MLWFDCAIQRRMKYGESTFVIRCTKNHNAKQKHDSTKSIVYAESCLVQI